MPRRSAKSITIDPNVRCQRIYPVPGTKKVVDQLQTVGFKMTRDQAIKFARVLLAVSQDWDEIDITGFRMEERKSDHTFAVTVTSAVKTN